ncbi:hypothetical protein [Leucobacter chromiiresistens]|uniref:hypothetical protein n=1 Tax=Leucobacter chromiiresistens TaxID=1079994 RepID=UPI00128F42A7|nr:hypothetical protein [Leucobacter chromiiresistens]
MSNERGNQTTNMTLDEQREWVGEQFDAAIEASGVSEGWYDIYDQNVVWADDRPEDRDRTLNSLFPRDCGSGGRLIVALLNTSSEDPIAASENVRAFWESEGWAVSNIRSYESDPYFRADGEDGAQLAFMATAEHMSLEVVTACSVHATVTNWQYRDEEGNEFPEELGQILANGGL